MSAKKRCVHRSKTCQTIKHLDNVISTCCENVVKSVWEFDNKFLNYAHTVVQRTFRGIWRTITFNVILTITNAISKNLPSRAQNGFQLWRTFTPCLYKLKFVNDMSKLGSFMQLYPLFKTVGQYITVCLFVWWCLTPFSTIFQLNPRRSALLVDEAGGPGENHWPVASHWQTSFVHLAPIEIRTHNISDDRHWLHR